MIKKQYVIYLLLMCLTITVTVTAFFLLKRDSIAFHEGETLFLQKKYQGALTKYFEALQLGYHGKTIYHRIGDAYLILGNFEKAAESYRQYLTQYPKDWKVRISLARVLSYLELYDESVKEYKQAMDQSHD